MSQAEPAFSGLPHKWTRARLDGLSRDDLLNLQANAEKRGEPELAALCAELARGRPQGGAARSAQPPKGRLKLVARATAFGARGVWLDDPRTSWSGIRKSDGDVVFAIWRAAVQSHNGACACLLWAPNFQGGRPWSDTPAGRERLEHCKLALQRGNAEGLLVHGEALQGRLPEDRARSVLGIDVETVIRFDVELRDGQYWASWGASRRRAAASSRTS